MSIDEYINSLIFILHTTRASKSPLALIHPEKQVKNKSYTNSGLIYVDIPKIEFPPPSFEVFINLLPFRSSLYIRFVDYVVGGCELNFVVALDFTASNGDVRAMILTDI